MYLCGAVFMGASFTFPFTLLALYLDHAGYDKPAVGTVIGGQAWGQMLAALPAAWLASRFNGRRILSLSAVATALCYAVLPFMGPIGVDSLLAITLANVVTGFAWSVHMVAGAPFLYRHSDGADRALLFSVSEAVRMGASVVGALLAGWLASHLSAWLGDDMVGHAWALSMAGLLPLFATPFYLAIDDPPPPASERPPFLPTIWKHRHLMARFALPQVWISIGSGLTIPFMSLYFTERFEFTSDGIGVLFAGGQVLMSFGFLMTPWILQLAGYVRGVATVQLLSLPFFLMLAFATSPAVAVVAFLMRTALMNSAHPLLKTFLMESAPAGLREVQNALLMFMWGLGWVVGPVVGGMILERAGGDYSVLMLTTSGMYVVGSCLSYFCLRGVEGRLAASKSAGLQAALPATGAGNPRVPAARQD
ncbi:Major Facilitator Superfamily protein [Planctomycetes bacterium Pla86]|uniref:Major Facilitator Superfamily protein n=2 Tax=Engelhardtia mirabilis TaxID=2528011 RepID=A0A518BR95_9BACT|nr:Major Facilitator Superfamily protein [Planctomycetes bacterium Pla133]QDV03828.1 Major Facilitator Superfamily protein [Planctomycetes bacterium Pla86]